MWNENKLEEFLRIVKSYEANGTNFSDIPTSVLPYLMEPVIWKSLDAVGHVKVFACLVIVIGGLLGNVSVILTVALTKMLLTNLNSLMVNLAVADAMICVFCMTPYAIKVMTVDVYIWGEFMCKFNAFIRMTCLISSVGTLSAMSYNFVIASTFPVIAMTQKRKNSRLIAAIWFVSMLVSVPLLIVKEHTSIQWKDFNETKCFENWPVEEYYDTSTGDRVEHQPLRVAYFVTICVTLFFVPIVIMITMNSWVLRKLCAGKPLGETRGNALQIILKRKRRATIRFLIIFVVFIICWTPTQVVIFYDLCRSKPTEQMPQWFSEFYWFAYYIAYANSFMNPIIYSSYNQPFQKSFRKLIRCSDQRELFKKSVSSGIKTTTSFMSGISRRLSSKLSSDSKFSSSTTAVKIEMCEIANNPSTPV